MIGAVGALEAGRFLGASTFFLEATRNVVADGVKQAYVRTGELREPVSEAKSRTITELVRGRRLVEVPGAYDPEKPDFALEFVTLPKPRLLSYYTTAPCMHECDIIKQIRHANQTHILLSTLNPIKQSLLRATAGHCGLDSAHCHSSTIKEVVKLDRPGGMKGRSREAPIFLRCNIASLRTASGLCKNEN